MKHSILRIYVLVIVMILLISSCTKPNHPLLKKELTNTIELEMPSAANLFAEPLDPLVFVSEYSCFVLRTDKSLWAAGNNQYGQLGDGTTINRSAPVKIMDNVKSVAAGRTHTLILKLDSTLWVTGNNSSGQLGIGSFVNQRVPVLVARNVLKIAAGDQHSLYTVYRRNEYKYGPFLFAAGSNASGQLGCNCDSTIITQFRQIAGSTIDIATGSNYSFIIKAGGGYVMMGTGANNLGQLGDGTSVNRRAFVQVAEQVLAVSAGQAHTLLLKADGTLWATGYNGFGQLGDGTSIRKTSFVQVADNVWRMAAGANHSLFISADNFRIVYGMGRNTHGQLGDGSTQNRLSPVALAPGGNRVAAGGYNSFFTRDNRSIMGTGYNAYGQLGNGSIQNQFLFVPVFLL